MMHIDLRPDTYNVMQPFILVTEAVTFRQE
jgi:hypothetical protein